MTGDQNDLIARLQRWLPTGWFPNDAPPDANTPSTRIYAVLSGFAAVLTGIYSQISFTALQTRLATTSGAFLDLAAWDFFGGLVNRFTNEADSVFSARINREVLRERLTRPAIAKLCADVGINPTIVELENPVDTGAWGFAMGYGAAGFWASRSDRMAVFIDTHYAQVRGIPTLAGWGASVAGWGMPSEFEYCGPNMIVGGGYSDADVFTALNSIRAAGITYWARFLN